MEHFLEQLESYLTMLDETEQKKIIKRYQKEIEGKIKDGVKEEDAIASLGSMDGIVLGIYEEYHLDKKNINEKNSFGGILNSGMKKMAIFLADTCAEVTYYVTHISSSALETFFEIILKVIVLLIILAFLKLPFLLLENIIHFGLNFLFYPFDFTLKKLSSFVIAVTYLIICISLSISMFKGYANKREKNKSEKLDKEIKKVKSSETSRNYAYIILKVCLYIVFIIPMILISLLLLLLTFYALFCVYKGVNIIGLVVILVGLLFLSVVVTTYITDALDNQSKNHTFALIVTVISLISGSILLVDNLMNFNYPKTLEESSFTPYIKTTTLDVNGETIVANLDGNLECVTDNSIQGNQLLVEFSYFDELYDIGIKTGENYIYFYTTKDEFEMFDVRYLYQNIFADLKNNKIYEYQKLANVDITIYGNEETLELLNLKE